MRKYFPVLFLLLSSALFSQQVSVKPVDLNNFDLSVKPSDDFYKYVNGNWLINNPIPPGNSSWSTFSILRQQNSTLLKSLIEDISNDKSAAIGSDRQMIRDFYNSGMDSVHIEKLGAKPLQPLFKRIDDIKSTSQLATVMGWLQLNLCNSGFRFYANPDPKNSAKNIAFIDQYGGFALPDRKYYIGEDTASAAVIKQYRAHITKMMAFAGQSSKQAMASAESALKLETIFAINCMTEEEFRNPKLTYHKVSIAQLSKIAPQFNWHNYFDALGLKTTDEINVIPPDFFRAFGQAISHNSLEDWKNYLKWCVVNASAQMLSADLANENFNFFEKRLNGIAAPKPRWQRVIDQQQTYLGWALGKEFVKKYFSPAAKAKMVLMIDDIKDAFRVRIQNLDWLSEATKLKALDKLGKINVKVGYPGQWRDYAGMRVTSESYLENVINCSNFINAKQVHDAGKPVNREEWGMTPQEVNAYYTALQNEIVFPAGILQPPFFDERFDDAVNYGAVGSVIAHEFSHAFDDQGSQYDAYGDLNNWWTESDLLHFKAKQDLIIEQYNQYTVLDGLHVNGALTVGENIADLGGLSIAFYAFKMHQAKLKAQPAKIDGLTPEQRFFIAWTQLWRENKTAEALKIQVSTRTTSPVMIRGFAPLSNMEGFIEAFGLKEGDKMVLPKSMRFTIW